jgi:hypothetical protein
MSIYPDDWPRCPVCGDFALDGKRTCGRLACKGVLRDAPRMVALDYGIKLNCALDDE